MINTLIIILLMILFEFNGYLLVDKIKINTKYYMIFGFILMIAIFEIISMPFVLFNVEFEIYKYFMIFILIVSEIVLLKYSKLNKESFNKYIKEYDSKKTVVLIITAIVGIYIAIVSVNGSDSWLYLPMVLDPIQTGNLIYKSFGMHTLDMYYKFLSLITAFSRDNYMFLMFWYKFLETFLILMTFAFISEQIFKKKSIYAYVLMGMGIVFQIIYLIPCFTDTSSLGALYKVSPNGTVLLTLVMIPLLFINMIRNEKSKFYTFLLMLTLLAVSSSGIYIYAFYVAIHGLYMMLIKDKQIKEIFVFENAIAAIPLFVFIMYQIYTSNIETLKILILSIPTFILYMLILVLVKEKHYYKFMLLIVILAYLVNLLLVFRIYSLHLPTPEIIYDNRFNSDKYPLVFTYGIYSIFLFIGVWQAFKYKRELVIATLSVFIFAANYYFYLGIGSAISNHLYQRVYVFLGLYLFVLYGIIYLLDKLFKVINHNNIKKLILILVIILFIGYNLKAEKLFTIEPYKFDQSMYEYKINDVDVISLLDYNFDKSYYLETNDESQWEKGINQIFELNTSLVKIDKCDSNCYVLEEKNNENNKGENVVYETPNYQLIYKGEE